MASPPLGWSSDAIFRPKPHGAIAVSRPLAKQGVRIVTVDPRKTRSSAVLADEHIFIQPSTDTAALIAMALHARAGWFPHIRRIGMNTRNFS